MPDDPLQFPYIDTFLIGKAFKFSAAHHLTKVDPAHKCYRMHGHNYEVTVTLSGVLNEQAMVLDYDRFAPFGAWLNDVVDHRNLNEIVPGETTAEVLAWWMASKFRILIPGAESNWQLYAVTVKEGDSTFATVHWPT